MAAPHPDPTTFKHVSSVWKGQASGLREGLSFRCVWEEQFMSPNHVSGAWASSLAQPTTGPEVRPGDSGCKVPGVRARQGHVLALTAGTSHGALLPAICSPASPPRMPGPPSWGWLGIFETAFVDKRLLAKKIIRNSVL